MAGPGGHEAERMAVKVVPDTDGFAEDLKSFLEREESNAKIDVALDLDTKEVEAKLKEISKDLTVTLNVELDDAGIKERLDALGKNLNVTVNADLDDKAAEGRLALLTRDREVHIHVNTQNNVFAKFEQSLSSVTNTVESTSSEITNIFSEVGGQADQAAKQVSGIGGAAGKASAVMQILGTVIMGFVYAALVNVIVIVGALAGAIALALAPAAFIAAGVAFALMANKGGAAAAKLKKSFLDVKKTVKSVVGDAVQPMLKALQKQLPQVNKWIGTLKGPLRSAFASSSKYVDEVTKGLEAFATNALGGVVTALKNPQLQGLMTGLKKMLADFGTALGSFFTELAKGGNDYGKTLEALGQAMITLAPALADLLNAFAKVSPGLIKEIGQDLFYVLQTLSDPGVLKALTAISSFALNTVLGAIELVLGALSAAGNASAVFAIAAGLALAAVEIAWMVLKKVVLGIWHELQSAASSIWGAIKSGIVDKVTGAVNAVINGFRSITGPVNGSWASVHSSTFGNLSSILSRVRSVFSSIRSAVSGAMSAVKGAFSSAWSYISGILSSISNAIGRISRAASSVKGVLGSLNPFGIAKGPASPGAGPSGPDDDPKPFAPMAMAFPVVEPAKAVQPMSITDDINSINSASSSLAKSIKSSSLDEPTSASGNGFSTLAQRVFNFTINAAPNVPTEETIVKALSYADALYAQ